MLNWNQFRIGGVFSKHYNADKQWDSSFAFQISADQRGVHGNSIFRPNTVKHPYKFILQLANQAWFKNFEGLAGVSHEGL